MRQTELCGVTTHLDTLRTAASDCRESLWSHLRMFINDLGMAGGCCHAVNAIHWHTANRGRAQRKAERQRTRRLVDIHINAKLSLCSAAMSPSWSPDSAAWSLRTRSFIFIPAHPLQPKLSRDVSKDVRRCPQNVFWCSKKLLRCLRAKFESPRPRCNFTLKTSEAHVKLHVTKEQN